MKFLLPLILAVSVHAQAPADKGDAAVELLAKAIQFIEMTGGRERLVAGWPEMVEQGMSAMKKQCPDCTAAFLDEWGKRMKARLNVDAYVKVAAQAYAKRFTSEELDEFLVVVGSQKTGKPIPPSPALQKKAAELMPAILGEITGGSAEIGAKLGGEIGAEIEKEHPEYVRRKPAADKE